MTSLPTKRSKYHAQPCILNLISGQCGLMPHPNSVCQLRQTIKVGFHTTNHLGIKVLPSVFTICWIAFRDIQQRSSRKYNMLTHKIFIPNARFLEKTCHLRMMLHHLIFGRIFIIVDRRSTCFKSAIPLLPIFLGFPSCPMSGKKCLHAG
jgi:hypothetical protein